VRAKWLMLTAVLGLALAAPAQAGDKDRPDPFVQIEALLNSKFLLQGVLREEDVALLFAHVRAALLAASEGREPPSSEELNRRAEAIGAEMKARGTLAGLLLLTAFEAAARQAVREALVEPAPSRR